LYDPVSWVGWVIDGLDSHMKIPGQHADTVTPAQPSGTRGSCLHGECIEYSRTVFHSFSTYVLQAW